MTSYNEKVDIMDKYVNILILVFYEIIYMFYNMVLLKIIRPFLFFIFFTVLLTFDKVHIHPYPPPKFPIYNFRCFRQTKGGDPRLEIKKKKNPASIVVSGKKIKSW
jgi:hypothetical protein